MIFFFHPYLGKWYNLTNIFQMGWNHHLVVLISFKGEEFVCAFVFFSGGGRNYLQKVVIPHLDMFFLSSLGVISLLVSTVTLGGYISWSRTGISDHLEDKLRRAKKINQHLPHSIYSTTNFSQKRNDFFIFSHLRVPNNSFQMEPVDLGGKMGPFSEKLGSCPPL